MESQRRLSLCGVIQLCWVCLGLVLSGCDSDKIETEAETAPDAGVVAPGIDPFCTTRPKLEFCEDFDGDELPGSFAEQRVNLSTMVLDSETASSLPNSLLISVESGGEGALQHQFEPGGKLRLFGMLYAPELGEGEVEIASFSLGDYRVGFGANEDGSLWVYEGEERRNGEGSLPVGRWASFRWDVNVYDDGTGTAMLRFGIDTIASTDELLTPVEPGLLPVATVGLFGATGAWTMRFDNLTVAVSEVN